MIPNCFEVKWVMNLLSGCLDSFMWAPGRAFPNVHDALPSSMHYSHECMRQVFRFVLILLFSAAIARHAEERDYPAFNGKEKINFSIENIGIKKMMIVKMQTGMMKQTKWEHTTFLLPEMLSNSKVFFVNECLK